eukprot:10488060-Alexandrium_andersonii.AAC.1
MTPFAAPLPLGPPPGCRTLPRSPKCCRSRENLQPLPREQVRGRKNSQHASSGKRIRPAWAGWPPTSPP